MSETERRPDADAGSEAQSKFDKRREKAVDTIVLSINNVLLYLLGEPVDPVAVWKQLAEQFQQRTWANKLCLQKRLYSLQLKSGDSIQKHIKVMTETFSALSAVSDKITNEDRVVLFLVSLPDSYSVIVIAREACAEVQSMEMVIKGLLHEEQKMKGAEVLYGREDEKAMYVKQQHQKGPKCFHCGQPSHIKGDCRSISHKPERKQKGRKAMEGGKHYMEKV